MDATIYHNPRCSNSRNALALLREQGIEPHVVDYLANPPAREQLRDLIAKAGLTVREAMRTKEAVYDELGLGDAGLPDDALLDAMVANPVLINRPFVVTPKGVRLCRPPELVREII
jgi:arsenate reductase (glutaredoxin)